MTALSAKSKEELMEMIEQLQNVSVEKRRVESELLKKLEIAEQLRVAEERFKIAFECSPDSININRLSDGLYIDVNEGFTKITGYTREEVIGKTSEEICIWYDIKDREKLVRGLREYGRVDNLVAKFRMKDGTIVRGSMSARIIEIGGEPYILNVTRDIESILQLEEAVKQEQQLNQSIIDNSGIYFIVVDTNFVVERINQEVKNLELWKIGDTFPGKCSDEEHTIENLVMELELNNKCKWRCHHRSEKGEFVVDWTFSKFQGDSILITGIDQTENKRLQDELEMSREVIHHNQKMELIERTTSAIAHEFRNYLQIIHGAIEVAEENPQAIEDAFTTVKEYTEKAGIVVKNLLRGARREKRNHSDDEEVDVNDIIRHIVQLVQRVEPHVSIELELEEKARKCRISHLEFEQIFFNLIMNSLDQFVGKDYGEIRIRGRSTERMMHFEIEDNGGGLTEEAEQHIFQPYFTTKPPGKGTGLGLTTIKRIINTHGGSIECENHRGQSVIFRFTLPLSGT